MDIRIQAIDIDTTEPSRLADFWEAALGWRRTYANEDEVVLEPPAGSPQDGVAPDLLFLRVLETKSGKNRLHLDLRPLDQAAEVARLSALGARRVDVGQGSEVSWVVMADPDGNEFCVLQALANEAPFVLPTPEVTTETHGNIDFYLPDGDGPCPAVVIIHGVPLPPDFPAPRRWPVYRGYGSQAAARGLVAAVVSHSPDGKPDYPRSNDLLTEAVAAIREHPRVAGDRIATWHFSGGGPLSAPLLRQPPPWLRVIALTYPVLGDVRVELPEGFRPVDAITGAGDLPIVLTTVGNERPPIAATVDRFRSAAASAGANLDVIDVPDGQHGFDFLDHTDASRDAVATAVDKLTAQLM